MKKINLITIVCTVALWGQNVHCVDLLKFTVLGTAFLGTLESFNPSPHKRFSITFDAHPFGQKQEEKQDLYAEFLNELGAVQDKMNTPYEAFARGLKHEECLSCIHGVIRTKKVSELKVVLGELMDAYREEIDADLSFILALEKDLDLGLEKKLEVARLFYNNHDHETTMEITKEIIDIDLPKTLSSLGKAQWNMHKQEAQIALSFFEEKQKSHYLHVNFLDDLRNVENKINALKQERKSLKTSQPTPMSKEDMVLYLASTSMLKEKEKKINVGLTSILTVARIQLDLRTGDYLRVADLFSQNNNHAAEITIKKKIKRGDEDF